MWRKIENRTQTTIYPQNKYLIILYYSCTVWKSWMEMLSNFFLLQKHFWLEKILPEKEVLLNIPCKPDPMVWFWDSNNGVNETSANGLTENNIPASKV